MSFFQGNVAKMNKWNKKISKQGKKMAHRSENEVYIGLSCF